MRHHHIVNGDKRRLRLRTRSACGLELSGLAAPLVCTYLGRSDTKSGRPFRFILNNSRATAANVYLMLYPKPLLAKAVAGRPALMRQVWEYLNAIRPADLLGEGRVYGGGLHKLEPKELGNVPVEGLPEVAGLLPARASGEQGELFELARQTP